MVVSDESGSFGYDQDDFEVEPPLEQQQESSKDNSHASMNQLLKQNSIFSLTLEEIQCKSGRSFGSMNMDEFLANIWCVEEENQCDGNEDTPNNKDTIFMPSTLPRQGSFSIPTPLCKKTVDEVWSEIDKSRPQYHDPSNNIGNSGPLQHQQTIGEITLEDFLVKAGVVQESPLKGCEKRMESGSPNQEQCGNNDMGNSSGTCLEGNFGIVGQVFGSGFLNQQNIVSSNLSAGNGYGIGSTYPMFGGQGKLGVGEGACDGPIEKCHSLPESSSGGGGKKKRIIDGPPEVVVERRQRRMIKNRESAARSRARKQAYTVELEAELNQLKDENTKLKESVAESQQRRKEELLKKKASTKAQKLAEKLRTMRRAVSW